MTSINISIKKEAYDFLSKFKIENKSFSDVILEFKRERGNKNDVMRFFGALKDANIDWEAKEKRMKEFRNSFEKRIKETTEYMERSRK
ncbi:antitoxin VapB family protein [Candidatus Woesearchaeota archaeon]|nr:antitoxin VapB family protein [Candidatus Woesearchaeota archaeon]